MLIATHCNLDFTEFDDSREQLIKDCHNLNIDYFIVPSTLASRWSNLFQLSVQYSEMIPAIGLHPYFIKEHQKSDLDELERRCQQNKGILIGETGLDFYRKGLDREKQIFFFEAHLAIAKQYSSPLIIHARKSHEQIISMIKSSGIEGGIIHAYNGSYEQAKQYLKYNFKFGFGGAMTYSSATKIRNLAIQLPIESILLETDAPDMRPSFVEKNYHNSPIHLKKYLKILAELRSVPIDLLEEQMLQNFKSISPNFLAD